MHRLMAADSERFSYFLYWETFFPALTEKAIIRAIDWLDRKLLSGALHRKLVSWDEETFGKWRHIHSQGLWIPEEDLFVMQAAFVPQQWVLEMPLAHKLDIFHVDELSEKRRRRWLRFYKACVKRQLLRNGRDRIHLSKNPVMSGWVDALIDTFPDARFVVMVRDPVQCIPSTLRMMETAWLARKWSRRAYAPSLQALTDISFDSYRLPPRALSQRPDTRHAFVDYRELTDAPKATIEKTYAVLGLPLTTEYERTLAAREARERKHSSQFKYDLDDYAVAASDIEDELSEFYLQYQWPRAGAQQQMTGA